MEERKEQEQEQEEEEDQEQEQEEQERKEEEEGPAVDLCSRWCCFVAGLGEFFLFCGSGGPINAAMLWTVPADLKPL